MEDQEITLSDRSVKSDTKSGSTSEEFGEQFEDIMKYDKIQFDIEGSPQRNYNPDVYGEMIDDGSFNFDMDHFIQGEIKFDEGDDAMCESCECVNCSCGKKY